MSELSYINEVESIRTSKLVSKRSWFYYLDKLAFIIYSLAGIYYGILIQLQFKVDGEFSGFLVYVLSPFFIILGLYTLFRKIRENDLLSIQTNLTKEQNLIILRQFLDKYNYTISDSNKDVIVVFDEHMMSFNGLWRKKYIYIIDDFSIYFNVTKLYPFISPPVLFGHLILKSDLKRFLNNSDNRI